MSNSPVLHHSPFRIPVQHCLMGDIDREEKKVSEWEERSYRNYIEGERSTKEGDLPVYLVGNGRPRSSKASANNILDNSGSGTLSPSAHLLWGCDQGAIKQEQNSPPGIHNIPNMQNMQNIFQSPSNSRVTASPSPSLTHQSNKLSNGTNKYPSPFHQLCLALSPLTALGNNNLLHNKPPHSSSRILFPPGSPLDSHRILNYRSPQILSPKPQQQTHNTEQQLISSERLELMTPRPKDQAPSLVHKLHLTDNMPIHIPNKVPDKPNFRANLVHYNIGAFQDEEAKTWSSESEIWSSEDMCGGRIISRSEESEVMGMGNRCKNLSKCKTGIAGRIEALMSCVKKSEKKQELAMFNSFSRRTIEYEKIKEEEKRETEGERRICCNCKKSRCLQLYCDCFSRGVMCVGCNCYNCLNTRQNDKQRLLARQIVLEKNPMAFAPKIAKGGPNMKEKELVHMRGCNCKKSGCQKKYCECYQSGIECGELCKCDGCLNQEEHHEEYEEDVILSPEGMRGDIESPMTFGCNKYKLPLPSTASSGKGRKGRNVCTDRENITPFTLHLPQPSRSISQLSPPHFGANINNSTHSKNTSIKINIKNPINSTNYTPSPFKGINGLFGLPLKRKNRETNIINRPHNHNIGGENNLRIEGSTKTPLNQKIRFSIKRKKIGRGGGAGPLLPNTRKVLFH